MFQPANLVNICQQVAIRERKTIHSSLFSRAVNAMSNQKWLLSPETTITDCFSMLPILKKNNQNRLFYRKTIKNGCLSDYFLLSLLHKH